MAEMFSGCSSLTVLNLGSFLMPANLPRMFYGCSKMKKIIVPREFDPSVYVSDDAFTGCVALVGEKGTTYDPEHVDGAYAHVDEEGNPGYFTESANVVSVSPEYGTVFEDGKTAIFSVTAHGEGLKYQWQTRTEETEEWKNTTLSGYNTNTLKVTADYGKNGKEYRCVITDRYGNGASSDQCGRLLLIVTPVQTVLLPLQEETHAMEGETVKIHVDATGKGLKYQWMTLPAGSTEWKKTTLTGYNTDTLTVKADSAKNGKQYCCAVTDKYGNVVWSDATKLVVSDQKLTISAHPLDVTVSAGATATFTITASGKNLKYQWQTLQVGAAEWKNTTLTGYNTATLKVSADVSKSGRQYRCVITDGNGNSMVSNAATLTVTSGPSIKTQPSDVTVNSGETATFSIMASGTGLKYQWQTLQVGAAAWKNTTLTGYNTATLKVKADVSKTGRQYRCVVTDKNGKTVTSNAATLTVNGGLVITTQPANVETTGGKTATFTVAATGEGLKYQWQTMHAGASEWKNTTVTGYNTATLNVKADAGKNGRQYRCVITDKSGKTVTSNAATLTVLGTNGENYVH